MSKGKYHHNRNKNAVKGDSLEIALSMGGNARREDLERPIEELDLSENTYSALKAGRITRLADLACRNFQQMYKIQNIGKKNCIEISKALAKFNVSFAKDEPKAVQTQNQPRSESREQGGNDRFGAKRDGRRDDRRDQRKDRSDDRRQDKNRNKNKGENAQLNDYLSKAYAGMSLAEILMGRRERPVIPKSERAPLTENSLVKFCRKGKWGYKDWKGNVVVPPQYEEAFGFFEERACVEREGKLGYIDRQNNLIIDFKYDCATSFSEGLASVTVGEKSGYIDLDGNQIVDFIYDIATPFSDGKAIVRSDDRWGVLSRDSLDVFWR